MLIKSKVKYIQSLSHKKQRDQDGVFVAEGLKIVTELLAAPHMELLELYAVKDVASKLADHQAKIIETDQQSLERISFLSTPNQVLGLFKKPVPQPLRIAGNVSIMLDNIQDPGNFGSIVRCADWFGLEQIICSYDCADAFGPKTVQSTMGSIARINIVYADLALLLAADPSIRAYAATLDGKSLYHTETIKEGIIIVGNESKGISAEVLSLATDRLTIPRRGGAESLNAAVATGIILSHVLK